MTTPKKLLKFEREPCSRCAGSGHYSYCEMWGTTCFKCQGKRETLTKRGRAAHDWMVAQMETVATDVKVGDLVVFSGGARRFVQEIKNSRFGPNSITFVTKDCNYGVGQDSKLQVRPKGEDGLRALRQATAEYQDTLTKAGKPRKRG